MCQEPASVMEKKKKKKKSICGNGSGSMLGNIDLLARAYFESFPD